MTDSEVVGDGEARGRFSEQAKSGEKNRREMEKAQHAKGDDDGGEGRGEREGEIRDEPFRKTDRAVGEKCRRQNVTAGERERLRCEDGARFPSRDAEQTVDGDHADTAVNDRAAQEP